MRVVAGYGHVQRIDDPHPRLPLAQDGIDKVVTEVAVGSAVGSGLNAGRQSILLNFQAAFDRVVITPTPLPVSMERSIKPAVFPTDTS